MKEENEERVQEILNNQVTEEPYNVEKTRLTISYINNNEVIKIAILLGILCVVSIIVVIKNNRSK